MAVALCSRIAVATLVAADLIVSRQTEHGGAITAIEAQTGPKGFDDLQISLELQDGSSRTLHAQCRYRQPFTGASAKFIELVALATAAIVEDDLAFATELKRLVIIVDHKSPGHDPMRQLCQLARDPGDVDRFVSIIERHGGAIEKRWNHCLRAAGDLEPERLHRVLASLEVRSVELDLETSRDSVALINRLAERWSPPDPIGATNLANALLALCTELATRAGMVEMGLLRSRLGSLLPATLGAETRREKLRRTREGGHDRTVSSLKALGLDEEAEMLATQILATPPGITISGPVVIVSGQMGVGKTTELERLHRAAIDEALERHDAPIPIRVKAAEIGHSSLRSALSTHVEGLGDPSRVGVHLVIDGLDEAGVQVSELTDRIATMQTHWPNSTVLLGTRPQEWRSGLKEAKVELLAVEDAQRLMEIIAPRVPKLTWLRDGLREVLQCPLFAIIFALNYR